MVRSREQIQAFLLSRDSQEDNPWTVWYGSTENAVVQLLNTDCSSPYVKQVEVNNQTLAFDPNLSVTTEIYRVSWIQPEIEDEPDANTGWWLSFDGGATKLRPLF